MKLSQEAISRIIISFLIGADNLNRRIVLIDTSGLRGLNTTDKTRNIYCLNEADEVIWQVNPSLAPKNATDCFISLNENSENTVSADRFFGDEFKIEIDTGRASHTGWHK